MAQSLKERFNLSILPPQALQAQLRICIQKEPFSYFLLRDELLGFTIPGIYQLQVYGKYPHLGTKEVLNLEGNMNKPLSGIAKLLSSSSTT